MIYIDQIAKRKHYCYSEIIAKDFWLEPLPTDSKDWEVIPFVSQTNFSFSFAYDTLSTQSQYVDHSLV